jgi:GT2 family glycosyltransferase
MTIPSVAVIIPTRDRPKSLKNCLRQILPYVNQHPECMIVVSDDGEASNTKAELLADFPGVQVIQGPRRGPAANRNWGAANSSGHLLIFLDDDCTPDSNVIPEYQRAARSHPECGVFEGRITAIGKANSFGDVAPANETGGYLWSCNFAIRRELFTGIGGFDERFPFPAMEDVDLRFRVAGKSPIRFLPEARVSHAFERRVGAKFLRHHTLSLILFLHLHGLNATKKGPGYFAHAIGHLTSSGIKRLIRRQAAKDPRYLLMTILANAQVLLIVLFWKFHPYLARKFFPPCCAACQFIHTSLAKS